MASDAGGVKPRTERKASPRGKKSARRCSHTDGLSHQHTVVLPLNAFIAAARLGGWMTFDFFEIFFGTRNALRADLFMKAVPEGSEGLDRLRGNLVSRLHLALGLAEQSCGGQLFRARTQCDASTEDILDPWPELAKATSQFRVCVQQTDGLAEAPPCFLLLVYLQPVVFIHQELLQLSQLCGALDLRRQIHGLFGFGSLDWE
jgi:hypothetical protein